MNLQCYQNFQDSHLSLLIFPFTILFSFAFCIIIHPQPPIFNSQCTTMLMSVYNFYRHISAGKNINIQFCSMASCNLPLMHFQLRLLDQKRKRPLRHNRFAKVLHLNHSEFHLLFFIFPFLPLKNQCLHHYSYKS